VLLPLCVSIEEELADLWLLSEGIMRLPCGDAGHADIGRAAVVSDEAIVPLKFVKEAQPHCEQIHCVVGLLSCNNTISASAER